MDCFCLVCVCCLYVCVYACAVAKCVCARSTHCIFLSTVVALLSSWDLLYLNVERNILMFTYV